MNPLLLFSQYDSTQSRLSQVLQLADVAGTKARLASLQVIDIGPPMLCIADNTEGSSWSV